MTRTLDLDVSRVLWMTEQDVVGSLSLNEAIAALRDALIAEASGQAANVDKTLGTWDGQSSLHALGAMMALRGYVGFKTWANTPQGAAAVFSLFNANDGQLLALMEAGALGQMRTAGIVGLATHAMADPVAASMAVIGTGAQSFMQVAAVMATTRLTTLRVYSRSADKRASFLKLARGAFALEVLEASSIDDAVRDAEIVTLITRAREPFLTASMLNLGTHVNAAGAILPGNAEFAQDVFDRASLIVVDSTPNARKASTEFRARFGADESGWQQVKTLGALLAGNAARPAHSDITLFKPMGMGLSDLAVAATAYERALDQGLGGWMRRGSRAVPRWQAA